MNTFKYVVLALLVTLGCTLLMVVPQTHAAQVSVGVNIGAAPDCPYGYYDYEPYDCAPYGYYGPEWFTGGVFIGTGPWFHGRDDFRGHVDTRFDGRHGYKGAAPRRGERADTSRHIERDFKGNEMHDGHGRVMQEGRR